MKIMITDIAKSILKDLIKKTDIVVDCTMGNGNDTVFLANISKHVYAFDIQEAALIKTKNKLHNLHNVTLIHDTFLNIFKYLTAAQAFLFNLGYLPGGNKSITTESISTLLALKTIYSTLKSDSFIMIVLYTGHPEGQKESIAINNWLKELDNQKTDVFMITPLNKKTPPPSIIIIRKY